MTRKDRAVKRGPSYCFGKIRMSRFPRRVNERLSEKELSAVRRSVERGTPLGEAGGVAATARRLGLEHTLRPRGRAPDGGEETECPHSP